MKLSTSIIAGCVAITAAESPPAAIVDDASPKIEGEGEGGVLTSPTNDMDIITNSNNNNNKPRHRLLQKIKKRRERAYNAKFHSVGGDSDVGILSNKNKPRFLEEENDYDYYCPRETCPAELCDCADSGGSLEDCTEQLQAVCRAGNLGDCVYKGYVKVYEEVYCPFAFCDASGHREDQCDCAFYELYCNRLQGQECTDVLAADTDEVDKKPFFGCDEEELASVCDEATQCKARGDLQGLDLGTWKGAVTTGITLSAGEKLGGGSVVMGVTLLSMILGLWGNA